MNRTAWSGLNAHGIWYSANVITPTPMKKLGTVDQSKCRQVSRNCSSIGLRRKKSRSPLRIRSENSLQFSRKSVSINPSSAKKQPTKKRYSDSDQLAITDVRANTVR